jgi:glycosyltransferase involved in cell wall biosynthesis
MIEEKPKKKPHIAMILPDRIDHPVGGMGVQAKYLINHLKNDFNFSVHGFPDDTKNPDYYGVYNPLPRIQHGGLNTLTGQVAYLASIFSLVEKGQKPDLIHVMDYTEYLAGIYASRVLNIPMVVSMQLSAHLMHRANLFSAREPRSPDGVAIENSMREVELAGLREAKHIIHVSNVYKKIFSEIQGLDEKSTYIPNGVDLQEFENPKKIILPGNGRLKMVFLGRFAPQKNVLALLQAYIPPEIDLIFVGEKSGDQQLFDLLARKIQNEKNIHYVGPAYGEEKIKILNSADAVIIPSLHECHPIVMHEALAARCIVLHSGAGDMLEILNDSFAINCGITSRTITDAVKIFASMSQEEILLRQKRGFDVVSNYTWKNAADKTAEIYNKFTRDNE